MLSRGRGHDIVGSRFPDGLSAKTLRASEFGLLRGQVQPSAVFLGEIKYAETISATRPRLRSANFVPSARDLLALGNHSTRSGEFPWGWQSTSSLTQPHGNSVEVILGRQLRETFRLKPKNLTTLSSTSRGASIPRRLLLSSQIFEYHGIARPKATQRA